INRGNSGGPLFNMSGEVIGVNTAILSPTGGSIGIGFSMASNVVTNVVDQLQEFGETRRGWLGVRIQDVTPEIAEALGLENAVGAAVTDVPEGPAAEAGMMTNDIIIEFDGQAVEDTRELVRIVGNSPVGKTVRVVVLRDGEEETLAVTLGRRETAVAVPAAQAGPDGPVPQELELLGLTIMPIDDEMREENDLGDIEGLAITAVDESSEAFEKGLRVGDIITEAGQQRVLTIEALEQRIEAAREAGRRSLLLLVRRGADPRFVALSLE
ncbi:MAG: PDZ domain-containing protein, partial [Shimia sp.]